MRDILLTCTRLTGLLERWGDIVPKEGSALDGRQREIDELKEVCHESTHTHA